MIKKHERDYSLLEKYGDIKLSKLWGISYQAVSQIRKKRGVANPITLARIAAKETIKQKIIEFIRITPKVKSLKEFKNKINIKGLIITIQELLDLAKANGLTFEIGLEFDEHNFYNYQKKICRCEICRLTNTLRTYSFKQGLKASVPFINKFANLNIELYKTNKEEFYKQFIDGLTTGPTQKQKDTEQPRPTPGGVAVDHVV